MSKGNMLMSQARGKLGGFVYSVVKGQQVQRAYNNKPSNPQTAAQLYQRALFVDAVKFYTRGRRELFQFAFEDKKRTESDYNAFMRANAKRGVVISKAAFDNYPYPALGNFILSKGTLQPTNDFIASGNTSYIGITKSVVTEETTVTNVGQLAAFLVDGVDYLADDILTFVSIKSGVYGPTYIPNVKGEIDGTTDWDIHQVMLTLGSTQPLSDFGVSATITTDSESNKSLVVRSVEELSSDFIFAGAVIHSRNTSTGVRTSTQELKLNTSATSAIDDARTRTYVDAVVETWRTTQQAPVVSETIMQGNIAQSIAAEFNPAGE